MLSGIANIGNSATNSTDKLLQNIWDLVKLKQAKKLREDAEKQQNFDNNITSQKMGMGVVESNLNKQSSALQGMNFLAGQRDIALKGGSPFRSALLTGLRS
jgi:hypothetical protein